MRLKDAMNDGDVGARKLVDGDVAYLVPCALGIGEEKNVSAIESRFHGPTEDVELAVASKEKMARQTSGLQLLAIQY
jgi:hypothetical protein